IPEQLRGVPKSTRSQQPEGPAPEADKYGSAGILAGWVAEKQYYPIGEVAALFQVRSSHIRFWTIEFQIHVRTTQKGDRLYNADNIQQLRLIYHLVRERGFTIPGAKAVLAQIKKPQPNTLELRG